MGHRPYNQSPVWLINNRSWYLADTWMMPSSITIIKGLPSKLKWETINRQRLLKGNNHLTIIWTFLLFMNTCVNINPIRIQGVEEIKWNWKINHYTTTVMTPVSRTLSTQNVGEQKNFFLSTLYYPFSFFFSSLLFICSYLLNWIRLNWRHMLTVEE